MSPLPGIRFLFWYKPYKYYKIIDSVIYRYYLKYLRVNHHNLCNIELYLLAFPNDDLNKEHNILMVLCSNVCIQKTR